MEVLPHSIIISQDGYASEKPRIATVEGKQAHVGLSRLERASGAENRLIQMFSEDFNSPQKVYFVEILTVLEVHAR